MPSQLETNAEVRPLAAFSDNPAEFLDQLKTSHRPIALTVDGHAEFVIQEASEYEHMLDLLEAAEVREAIHQGLEDVKAGRTRPAEEFFAEMRERYGIPR